MSADRAVAVMKFGGTSVATPAARALAGRRVTDGIAAGFAVVAVVSAMGRAPDPYATDSLLALVARRATRNADLLASAGETIAAAVFAEELCAGGVPAIAITGGDAGIRTDGCFGDAAVLAVDPAPLRAMLAAGSVPVVAGFQGVGPDGAVTTLGRGGTDLSAIALGHALGAERVDIYTDVTGAMSADPRRIPQAQPIEQASLEEISELAEHGAKVMHHKAADFAARTGTRYAIRDLHSGRGTLVDETPDHHRIIAGVTVTGMLTWVRVIRGDIETPSRRMETELEMFRRIAAAGVSIDQVSINQAGVAFVVAGDRGNAIRELLGDLNLAVRVREGCAKLSVVGSGMRGTPGVVERVVDALSRANVEIIHCTDSNITISVLVPAADAARAERAVHDRFLLSNAREAP